MNITEIFSELKTSSWHQKQTSVEERLKLLKRLDEVIDQYQDRIVQALQSDFQKSEYETLLTEIYPVLQDIKVFRKKLKGWMSPQKVGSTLALFGTSSEIRYEAKGCVLIISPWNYPFQLAMAPLVAALAAGNTVVLKPSEMTPATSAIMKEMLEGQFPSSLIRVVEGGAEVTTEILKHPFDHIFFTGSTSVGKIVMEAASRHLSGVTLELGGKSPAIVDKNFSLEIAATKIAWGKFLNAGQTCVAPDHVYIPKESLNSFQRLLHSKILEFYSHPEAQEDFPAIVSAKHVRRIEGFIQEATEKGAYKIEALKLSDSRKISPIILTDAHPEMRVMREEIFGPVLPLITYETIDEVISHIRSQGKPLALYVFSNREGMIEKILRETSSGGVCINDTLIHLMNHNLPFGGVGSSGMGNYHGHFGFKTFSHERGVLKQGPFSKLMSFFYPPYTRSKLNLVKAFIKYRL